MAWPTLPFGFLGPKNTYKVTRSLRFNSVDSARLNRTFVAPTTQNTFTFSCWVKLGVLGTARTIFAASSTHTFGFTTTNALNVTLGSSVLTTTGLFRDPSSWYHVVWSSSGAAGQNQTVYVNGVSVGVGTGTTSVNTVFNTAVSHLIGAATTTTVFFNGYMADVHFIDGQALTPGSFAETDAISNKWVPKQYSGTYGNNGFKLNFSDNSGTTATTLGKDSAGTNNWTPTGFVVTEGVGNDSLLDSPTDIDKSGNYCTWNPLINGDTCLNGNLDVLNDTARGTQALLQYDAYWEITSTGGTTTAGIISSTGTANTTTIATGKTYGFKLTTSGALSFINLTDSGTWTSITTGVTGTVFPYASAPASTTASLNAGQRRFANAIPSTNRHLWLRADTGVTVNGSNQVTTWADQSGGNRNFTDATPLTGRPTYLGDSLKFTSTALYNDANASTLSCPDATIEINTAYTLISVVRVKTVATIFGKDTDEQKRRKFCQIFQDGTFYALEDNNAFDGGISYYTGTGNNVNIKRLLIQNFSSNSAGLLRYNGSEVVNVTNGSFGITSGNSVSAFIGVDGGFSQGDGYNAGASDELYVYEIIMFSRSLTTAEMEQVERYLNQKYDIYTSSDIPSGVCTKNLPIPAIVKPDNYMNTLTYTGNAASRTLTGLNFSPDLVWMKNRSGTATDHAIYDSVRGAQQDLGSNLTTDETTQTQGLTAFNSNGFDIGTLAKINTNAVTYVAWAWDESAISGLDIVSYTGDGANRTIAHNLGVAPRMIIVKARTTAGTDQGWPVYHASLANTQYLLLNSTAAAATGANYWNSTTPTSSVFSLGTNAAVNLINDTYIAYCFAEVDGFSMIRSYTGNANADGAFIWCGFRPAFIMIKSSTAVDSWLIYDNKRNIFNVAATNLVPNTNAIDATISGIDFLSNGFKLRTITTTPNAAQTYIFAAFAESPFKYANAK